MHTKESGSVDNFIFSDIFQFYYEFYYLYILAPLTFHPALLLAAATHFYVYHTKPVVPNESNTHTIYRYRTHTHNHTSRAIYKICQPPLHNSYHAEVQTNCQNCGRRALNAQRIYALANSSIYIIHFLKKKTPNSVAPSTPFEFVRI